MKLLLILVAIVWPLHAFGQSGKTAFLAEYREPAAELRKGFENVSYTWNQIQKTNEGKAFAYYTYKIKVRHGMHAMESTGRGVAPDGRKLSFAGEVDLRNHHYRAMLNKTKNGLALSELTPSIKVTAGFFSYSCAYASAFTQDQTYYDYINHPSTELIADETIIWRGQTVRQVIVDHGWTDKDGQPRRGRRGFCFRPDFHWLCVGIRILDAQHPDLPAEVENVFGYTAQAAGLPNLESIRVFNYSVVKSDYVENIGGTVTDFVRYDQPLPDSHFTLSHYGLPEPVGDYPSDPRFDGGKADSSMMPSPPPLKPSRFPDWLWIVGSGCVVGGIVIARRKRPATTPHRARASAFTLVELIVVCAILAVLSGLALPAIQKARARAERVACENNLHQLAIGLQQHHDARHAFPRGLDSETDYALTGWELQILPFIGQDSLYHTSLDEFSTRDKPIAKHQAASTLLRVMACPSDARTRQVHRIVMPDPRFQFEVALGSYLGSCGTTCDNKSGVLFRDSQIRIVAIQDGASHTLLLGERPPSADLSVGMWFGREGYADFITGDTVLGVREIASTYSQQKACGARPYAFQSHSVADPCAHLQFWSPHPGGANVAFADGSVRFLNYSAGAVLPALSTRSANDPISID